MKATEQYVAVVLFIMLHTVMNGNEILMILLLHSLLRLTTYKLLAPLCHYFHVVLLVFVMFSVGKRNLVFSSILVSDDGLNF